MKFARHTRRSIALIAAVLLFMCQTAFAAAACVHGFAMTAAAAEIVQKAPCHEGMDHADMGPVETAPQPPASYSVCNAPKAASQSVEVPSFAIGDLPSLTLPTFELRAIRVSSVVPHEHESPCSSTPLILLHCRLLN